MPRRKLLVPGIDNMLNQYREEIGEEFGVYRPVSERELSAIKPKKNKEKNTKNDSKSRK